MLYCHTKNYELKYTDVDFKDTIKISSLLSALQESACLSADELGFGYSVLQPKGFAFVLSNWYVELREPIKLGNLLTVKTWPIEPKKLIALRDFEICVGDKRVGVACSRWCLVDLCEFKMLPCAAAFGCVREYNPNRVVDLINWKIPAIAGKECGYRKIVSYSDYDHYNHVNNTKYADFFVDALPMTELTDKYISKLKISYIKQCKVGDELRFFRVEQEDGSTILECRVGEELRAQAQFYFNE